MPETTARALTRVWLTSSSPPPWSQAMAAPAAHPAQTAPQKAERGPMPDFWWMVSRSESTTARSSFSSPQPRRAAYTATGTEAVMPWLPLPERMTAGSSQPFIRASDPAAAMALASTSGPSP